MADESAAALSPSERRRLLGASPGFVISFLIAIAGGSGYVVHDSQISRGEVTNITAMRNQLEERYDELRKEQGACLQHQIDQMQHR
jgi:hypothetical protein